MNSRIKENNLLTKATSYLIPPHYPNEFLSDSSPNKGISSVYSQSRTNQSQDKSNYILGFITTRSKSKVVINYT